jgi:hypothetical protein
MEEVPSAESPQGVLLGLPSVFIFLVLSPKNSLPLKNKNKKYLKEETETYRESRLK